MNWSCAPSACNGCWHLQFLPTTLVLFGPGLRFYRQGIPALSRLAPDMCSLVAVGTMAAYAYSVVATFAPGLLPAGTMNVYYEAAAGVGVARQEQTLAGYLSLALHRQAPRPVQWTLHAKSGLTTRRVHELLRAESVPPVDVAAVMSGVNDVIDLVSPKRATEHRTALADWLLVELGVVHVLFAPLPPVHRFPLLPQPLRGVMGRDAQAHNAALRRWVATRRDESCAAIDIELQPDWMASDGFHPGEPVY